MLTRMPLLLLALCLGALAKSLEVLGQVLFLAVKRWGHLFTLLVRGVLVELSERAGVLGRDLHQVGVAPIPPCVGTHVVALFSLPVALGTLLQGSGHAIPRVVICDAEGVGEGFVLGEFLFLR